MDSIITSHALVVHMGKLLLMLRDDMPTIDNPNRWSLIGGLIEEGESSEDALLRECYEEIGVRPSRFEYLGIAVTPDDTHHAIFMVRLDDSEVSNIKIGNEGQELSFFGYDELKNIELTSNFRSYLDLYGGSFKSVLEEKIDIDPQKLGLI